MTSGIIPMVVTIPSADDMEAVTSLLGRVPEGNFAVVVRRPDGQPMVIANEPLLRNGTPMPTRYWLVDPDIRNRVGRLEAAGGVKEAEAAVDPAQIAACHLRYAQERDALISGDWSGPRPYGGVGGTRTGVKCLHAHMAWWLVGGNDPVGEWTAQRLSITRTAGT